MSDSRLDEPDFQPCPVQPIISGPGSIPAKEFRERLLFEKVTELAFSQHETCRLTRERDALTRALAKIADGNEPKSRQFARDILARLSGGELRRAAP